MLKGNLLKRLAVLFIVAMLIYSTLTACSQTSSESSDSTGGAETTENTMSSTSSVSYSMVDPGYTDRDLDSTWDESAAVYISLNGSSIEADGSGVTIDGSNLTITSEGVYVISGTLSAGQISVEASDTAKIQIVLNGVSVTSADGPAISITTADKVFITLAENSENTLTDSATYTLADGEDEPNATLYSKQDLTINGSGSLTVTGNYMHGILTKDDLVISGGMITVTASEDGIRGRDSVGICGGTITVTSECDGIKSNNDSGTDKGWISLDGGSLTIQSGEDGIQAETVLQVTGSNINIVTGGGSINAQTSTESSFGWGNSQGQEDTDSTSTKGLKASGALFITGGTVTVDALDDSIHSNGTISMSGGTLNLSSGDDGIHADGQLLIEGGTITVSKSYEGIEGIPVIITGGEIRLTASDDGINAAGDDSSSTNGEVAGPYSASAASEDTYIDISGGLVVVDAGGDGIDSNRDFYMSGGTVLVTGPTDGANSSLDVESTAEITGGTFIAVGSTGMAMNFSSTSTQPSLMVNYSTPQSAGTLLTLLDSGGNVVASFQPDKVYQSVIISTPDMQSNNDYTLYTGGNMDGTNTDGLWSGNYTPGTEVITVTMSDTIVSTTDTGNEITGMGGMGQGGGGMGQGGGPGNADMGAVPSDDFNGTAPSGGFPSGETPPSGDFSEGGAPPSGDFPGNDQQIDSRDNA